MGRQLMLFLGASSGPDQRAALLGRLLGERKKTKRKTFSLAPPPPPPFSFSPSPPLPLSTLAQGHWAIQPAKLVRPLLITCRCSLFKWAPESCSVSLHVYVEEAESAPTGLRERRRQQRRNEGFLERAFIATPPLTRGCGWTESCWCGSPRSEGHLPPFWRYAASLSLGLLRWFEMVKTYLKKKKKKRPASHKVQLTFKVTQWFATEAPGRPFLQSNKDSQIR